MTAPFILTFPHCVVDLTASVILRGESRHPLSSKEQALLMCLAKAQGQAVTTGEICAALGVDAGTKSLSVMVYRLHKKLEEQPKNPKILLRQYGGRFVLQLPTDNTPKVSLTDGHIEPHLGRVHRADQDVHVLSEQLRTLFGRLLEAKGQIVPTHALLETLGPHTSEATLPPLIRKLRQVIEPDPKNPIHLRTARGEGYQFIPAVRSASDRIRIPLIGRSDLVNEILTSLKSGHRWFTILGPGGCGKTRLMEEVVDSLQHQTTPQQDLVFCDASTCYTNLDVLSCLERALAMPPQRSQHQDQRIQALAETLRARGPVLMLVDNMEQAPMDVDAVMTALFRLAPQTQWVLTSRRRLGANAERIIHVGPLAVDDSVQIFRHRAAYLGHPLPDSPDLAQMVAPLEGNPLAVLLAASQLQRTTITALAEHLTHSALTWADEDNALHRVIEGSLALLSDTERNVLGQCAWFDGGFTVEVSTDVVKVPEEEWLDDVLMTLVDHSLLYPSDPGAPHRFYMYETVRETLKKEWSTPPKDLAARFVAAYGARHQGGRAALATPEQEQMRAQQLTAEAANLFVAQALAQSLPGDDARWVLDAFVWIWMRQGRFLECTQILTQWIHLETATEATRRDARRDYVDVCLLIRALPEVTPLIPLLLSSATESLTDDVRFETLLPVSQYYKATDQFDEHIACLEPLLALPHLSARHRAHAQHLLGVTYRLAGRREEALDLQRSALATPGHTSWKNQARGALAIGLMYLRRTDEAIPLFEEVYQWDKKYGSALKRIASAGNLGRTCLVNDRIEAGWTYLHEGWTRARDLPPNYVGQIIAFNFAGACLATGRLEVAAEVLDSAMIRAQRLGRAGIIAMTQSFRASLHALRYDAAAFATDWAQAMDNLAPGMMLTAEEIDAVGEAYEALCRTDAPIQETAEFIGSRIERPYIRLQRTPEETRKGSGAHELHVLILQEWVRRTAHSA